MSDLYVDFLQGETGYRLRRVSIGSELLAKAIGVTGNKKPIVLDVTAGLGRDGFVLATLGCEVTLVERSPVVAAALQDALQRALADPKYSQLKIHLIHTDAIKYLQQLENFPDVIYLDPMYPHRTKSALVKKEMRILRELVGEDTDAPDLLKLALQRAKQRVVVKRPCSAMPLGDLKPHHAIQGKQHRFDVYIIKNLKAIPNLIKGDVSELDSIDWSKEWKP